ncbi:MAG TPA: hypothetical protein VGE55_01465 [Limnobacter sp.]|uniref:hypothetical protein n=1 Tax=Limnobacter sp. TaxID=2003368 RepID=UPI002ED9E604
MGTIIFLALLVASTAGFWTIQHTQHVASFQRKANTRLQLQTIQQTLLNFASRQGINTLTQPGHLPCPAASPGGQPLVVCTDKRVGFWPTTAVIKVNYLGSALGHTAVPNSPMRPIQWHYGVSAQLVQPNPLGWSQWVNFDLPTLTIRTPEGTHTGISAVVAANIQVDGPDQWTVQPPYLLLSQAELERALQTVVREQALFTVRRWIANQTQVAASHSWVPQTHENLTISNMPDRWQPQNSGCQCHCTKTRCTCGCAQQAHWVSMQTCAGSTGCSGSQLEPDGSTLFHCISSSTSSCMFKGPAGLNSRWPVSRYAPEAGSNRPCNPGQKPWCPTSPGAEACDCEFTWPASVLGQLTRIQMVHGEHGWTATMTNP